jgi:hypothetical protein
MLLISVGDDEGIVGNRREEITIKKMYASGGYKGCMIPS